MSIGSCSFLRRGRSFVSLVAFWNDINYSHGIVVIEVCWLLWALKRSKLLSHSLTCVINYISAKCWKEHAIVVTFSESNTLNGAALFILADPSMRQNWWTRLLTTLCDLTYHSWPLHHQSPLRNSLITLMFSLGSDKSLNNTRCYKHLSPVWHTHGLIMFVFYVTHRLKLMGAAALSAPGCCYSYCNVLVRQPVTFAFL